MTSRLHIAQIIPDTDAEGPGRRFAIWLQGCPLRCPGCCNPEMLSDRGGRWIPVEALARSIVAQTDIEGISVLGGEPFAQASGLVELLRAIGEADLGLMIFSGFTLAELRRQDDLAVAELLERCDLLVDGRYDRTQPDTSRRWVGSRNQVVHALSSRYDPRAPEFFAPNTVELRLTREGLTVSGWPATARRVQASASRGSSPRAPRGAPSSRPRPSDEEKSRQRD